MIKKNVLFLITVTLIFLFAACNQDPFAKSIYSEQPTIITYQDYLAENVDLPAEGTDPILASGSEKGVIKKNYGFHFNPTTIGLH